MKWYRINIDYLWHITDNAALETSSPAGKDIEKAIKQYKKTISENLLCCDDKTKPAKIELTEYVKSSQFQVMDIDTYNAITTKDPNTFYFIIEKSDSTSNDEEATI